MKEKKKWSEMIPQVCSENPSHAPHDINCQRINALALVKASVRINCTI